MVDPECRRVGQTPRRPLYAMLLVLVGLLILVASQPAPLQAEEEPEVYVILQASPSIRVARGTTLALKIRIENDGNASMTAGQIAVAYDPAQVTLFDAAFDSDGDFVKRIESNRVVVSIGELDDDTARFIVLYWRVSDQLPDDTVITMMAELDWSDNRGNYDLNERSNTVPVLVGSQNETSEYVWVAVDPVQAAAGSQFHFFSDRFIPEERVTPILRYPDGRQNERGDLRQTVTPDGRVWIHLESAELPAGDYQLILEGDESELVGVATFRVE